MMLVNGSRSTLVDVFDRGFQYGDGLFETLTVSNGKPVFFSRHFERLQVGCRRLRIPCPDRDLIAAESLALCKHHQAAVLKWIVTRGSGGRGYRQPETVKPTRVLSLHPFPDYPPSYRTDGVVARFCETRLGLNPALAGIKHLNRLEQVLARAEWDDASIQEGIMLDNAGRIIEGTMSNLFWFKGGRLRTPDLTQAGIAGVMRGIILAVAAENGLDSAIGSVNKDELLTADALFFCNSVIGIWPIRRIEDRCFPVGALTQALQALLDRYQDETRLSEP